MPEPCPKASRVTSRRKRPSPAPAPRPAPSRYAALFKLDDPDERRALDWMQRFHGPDENHRLLDVARAPGPEGKPDVFMLSECAPALDDQEPSWLVFRFELAEIRVTWRTFGSLDAARAAFSAAVAIPRKVGEETMVRPRRQRERVGHGG